MSKPKIKITLVDRIGKRGCHRGHKIGDSFDYETDRGKLCPMAMHVAFPYIDILRWNVSIAYTCSSTRRAVFSVMFSWVQISVAADSSGLLWQMYAAFLSW